MRIAINTRFLIPGKMEGLGWYTHELLKRMVAAHPEVEFHFLFDRPYSQEFIYGSNVVANVLRPPARHPFLWYIWFEWSVSAALKRIKPDVFWSPDNFLSLDTRVPTVLTCHDLLPFEYPQGIPGFARWFYQRYWPKYFQKAAHIITISETTKSGLQSRFGIDNEQVTVVYNGIREGFNNADQDSFSRLRQMPSPAIRLAFPSLTQAYFLAAGSIHPRKNTVRLIEAFGQFKLETGLPHQLVLAGRMMLEQTDIEVALRASAYRQDIILTGYVSDNQLQELTRCTTAAVVVSLGEGFGLPIVEAMASCTPVIASNLSCLPEIAGDAALFVDPYRVEAIADGLSQIAQNEALANELVARGLKRSQLFSWDAAAGQVFEVLYSQGKQQIGQISKNLR